MSVSPISRTYAGALYELAAEEGIVEALLKDLEALSQALPGELESFLLSPKVPLARRQAVLDELFAQAHPRFLAFLQLVVRKGRAGLLAEMAEDFRLRVEASQGRIHGLLESAVDVDEDLRGELADSISKTFGKTVQLETRTRPELLGGFRVRAAGRLLDASLRTRLEALRKHMKAAAVTQS